jgi:hypothetical protein
MNDYDSNMAVALEIALDAGVLDRCAKHDTVFAGDGDLQHAFDLGGERLATGALGRNFDGRDELNEFIAEVVSDHRGEECVHCRELREPQAPEPATGERPQH